MNYSIRDLIERALDEDIGTGDATSLAIIPPDAVAAAKIMAKQDLVLAGIDVARAVFHHLDPAVKFAPLARDGDRISKGSVIAHVSGKTRILLSGERVALNILQHLSGIATLTARYVELVKDTKARILDTRKTLPGLRSIEKYAIRVGGGTNHRFGLYDGILIKDNHIIAAGGVTKAIELARKNSHHLLKIEIETKSLEDVQEALSAKVDIIMLDNMPLDMMREAVRVIAGRVLVEASGNVTLETVRAIAETGVDFISTGSITHSAPAVDISMKLKAD